MSTVTAAVGVAAAPAATGLVMAAREWLPPTDVPRFRVRVLWPQTCILSIYLVGGVPQLWHPARGRMSEKSQHTPAGQSTPVVACGSA